MPAKNPPKSKEPQIKKFRRLVRAKIDAGELNPIEADAALDKLVAKARTHKP